jgi:hypothetical protein
MSAAPKGQRNQTLFNQSAWLYRMVLSGDVSRSDADGFIQSVATQLGLPGWEVKRTIESAIKKASEG